MGYFEEAISSREEYEDLFEVKVPEGSLISTPSQTKEDCIKQFNVWLKETFK